MVVGAIGSAVMLVLFLLQSKSGTHSFGLIAAYLAIMLFFLGVAYTPWMASYTETVEHHNPAAVATGLAIWGWIIRVVVFGSSLLLLLVINTVTPLVSYGPQVSAYAAQYPSLIWAGSHGKIVADAQKYSTPLSFAAAHPDIVANAQKFGPELAIIQAHAADFTQAAAYTNPATIPPALLGTLVADAGGGATGIAELTKINANKAAINGVIANAAPLTALAAVPSSVISEVTAPGVGAQLAALAKVPPSVDAYMAAHASSVVSAAAKSPGQWKTWWWVCVGGLVFFLLSVPLLRGRWSPAKAKADEEAHEALVQAELAKLQGAVADS
jgi:hypothetical protein